MMAEERFSVEQIVAQADVEPFEEAELEGAAIVDAFVIFRYQRPEWEVPRTAYAGSRTMTDELRIGIVTMVSDRLRNWVASRWVGDDE